MNFYSIAAVAAELGIHESSLRRWEDMQLIIPERVNMGKTNARIYSGSDLNLLREAKKLMDGGLELRGAFLKAMLDISEEERMIKHNTFDLTELGDIFSTNKEQFYLWIVVGSPVEVKQEFHRAVRHALALRDGVRIKPPEFRFPREEYMD